MKGEPGKYLKTTIGHIYIDVYLILKHWTSWCAKIDFFVLEFYLEDLWYEGKVNAYSQLK